MPDNLADWRTFNGEAFNVKRPESGDDDKTYFALKVQNSKGKDGAIINCTLWDNSHGHIVVERGDIVYVNGKLKKKPKSDGDGFWYNLSVARIAVIPMDGGVDDREEDDEPKPARKTAAKRKPRPVADDEGVADDDDVM